MKEDFSEKTVMSLIEIIESCSNSSKSGNEYRKTYFFGSFAHNFFWGGVAQLCSKWSSFDFVSFQIILVECFEYIGKLGLFVRDKMQSWLQQAQFIVYFQLRR